MAEQYESVKNQGPNIDIQLYPDAVLKGAEAGQIIGSPLGAAFKGISAGVESYIKDTQGFQQIAANNQQQQKSALELQALPTDISDRQQTAALDIAAKQASNAVNTDQNVIAAKKADAISQSQINSATAQVASNPNVIQDKISDADYDNQIKQYTGQKLQAETEHEKLANIYQTQIGAVKAQNEQVEQKNKLDDALNLTPINHYAASPNLEVAKQAFLGQRKDAAGKPLGRSFDDTLTENTELAGKIIGQISNLDGADDDPVVQSYIQKYNAAAKEKAADQADAFATRLEAKSDADEQKKYSASFNAASSIAGWPADKNGAPSANTNPRDLLFKRTNEIKVNPDTGIVDIDPSTNLPKFVDPGTSAKGTGQFALLQAIRGQDPTTKQPIVTGWKVLNQNVDETEGTKYATALADYTGRFSSKFPQLATVIPSPRKFDLAVKDNTPPLANSGTGLAAAGSAQGGAGGVSGQSNAPVNQTIVDNEAQVYKDAQTTVGPNGAAGFAYLSKQGGYLVQQRGKVSYTQTPQSTPVPANTFPITRSTPITTNDHFSKNELGSLFEDKKSSDQQDIKDLFEGTYQSKQELADLFEGNYKDKKVEKPNYIETPQSEKPIPEASVHTEPSSFDMSEAAPLDSPSIQAATDHIAKLGGWNPEDVHIDPEVAKHLGTINKTIFDRINSIPQIADSTALIKGQIAAESQGIVNNVSKGESAKNTGYGLMQLTAGTAAGLGVGKADILDPEKNVAAGTKYDAQQFDAIKSQLALQLGKTGSAVQPDIRMVGAAYNGGLPAVKNAIAAGNTDWPSMKAYLMKVKGPRFGDINTSYGPKIIAASIPHIKGGNAADDSYVQELLRSHIITVRGVNA